MKNSGQRTLPCGTHDHTRVCRGASWTVFDYRVEYNECRKESANIFNVEGEFAGDQNVKWKYVMYGVLLTRTRPT